jgi:hypothetical protein
MLLGGRPILFSMRTSGFIGPIFPTRSHHRQQARRRAPLRG